MWLSIFCDVHYNVSVKTMFLQYTMGAISVTEEVARPEQQV